MASIEFDSLYNKGKWLNDEKSDFQSETMKESTSLPEHPSTHPKGKDF